MLFITPAMPMVSSGRLHSLPPNDMPAAAGEAGAGEHADIRHHLLLEIDVDAAAAAVAAHVGGAGDGAGLLRQGERVVVASHMAAAEEGCRGRPCRVVSMGVGRRAAPWR
jgi:hypothetical protein